MRVKIEWLRPVHCSLDYSAGHPTDDITTEISCGKTSKPLVHPNPITGAGLALQSLAVSISSNPIIVCCKDQNKHLVDDPDL